MGMDVALYVDRIVKAKGSAGGNILRDGAYSLAIRNLKIEPSSKGSEVWFKAEMYVVESANVDVAPALLKPNEPAPVANAAASDAVYITDIGKQVGQGNCKSFLCALLGKSEAEADADPAWFSAEITKAIGADQPYRGRAVGAVTYRKEIKGGANAGKPFTGYNWKPLAQTDAEIAEIRTLLK